MNLLILTSFALALCATGSDTPRGPSVQVWLTKPDESIKFQHRGDLTFQGGSNGHPTITVDESHKFQDMDGYGCAMTGGSALLIKSLRDDIQDSLLRELFSTDGNSIGISYLRISIGASDMSDADFTYDERPNGQTDDNLDHFSIDREQRDLIPILKKVVQINPHIKIMGTPWTAPLWMKTQNSYKGGSLKQEHYHSYAQYFVKYIHAMRAEGIIIDAITPQNEPLNPNNDPSMSMQAGEQADFIKNHLGPAFRDAGISTKIIIYDHNADRPDYPLQILRDKQAAGFVDGSAFHLYGGSISALTDVHNQFPNKNVYFTEQWVGAPSNFGGDLHWHIKTLVIGAPRNWAKTVLEWNLAADPNNNPHTPGGCTSCLGAITISGNQVTRNVGYYIMAHGAKFVRPGSVRINSNVDNQLENVAFKTQDGKKVLIVVNDGGDQKTFNIQYNGQIVTTDLVPGEVATYVWS